MNKIPDDWIEELQPSSLVRRFAPQLAERSLGKPILDVACGSGRNALVFSQLGCAVACIDKDLRRLRSELDRLQHTLFKDASSKLTLHELDLTRDPWPFSDASASGIVSVHFLLPSLFPFFEKSLAEHGFLLLETVPGHGGNYLQLPRAGELRAAFAKSFVFEFYRERPAGPRSLNTVTVQLIARRAGKQGVETSSA
jgi:SAM-dependent methyltransferase